MAIIYPTAVEIRTTGNAINGGGYASATPSAGTDYTQQDNAQLTIADADCNNSTTVTSVTGGFTTAMIGNLCRITGAGYTSGFYLILTCANTNTITIDRNPTSAGGHPTTGALSVGGAQTSIDNYISASVLPVNSVFHIKLGTYTFAGITLPGGNNAGTAVISGYQTTREDHPTGANRPVITMSAKLTMVGVSVIQDVIITGNFNDVLLSLATDCSAVNCKITQTNGTANVNAIAGGGSSRNGVMGCEVTCAAGYAVNGVAYVDNCYIHDSSTGYYVLNSQSVVQINGSIFDTCSVDGIKVSHSTPGRSNISNSTIYNCGDGLDMANWFSLVNCIIKGCTVGIRAAAAYSSINRNNVVDNTTNYSSFTADSSNIAADPLLTDPANGDFTLQAGSPAKGAAFQVGTNVGAVGTYNQSVGVYESAGSSGQVISVS
jgi:hypothetical protein